VLRCPEFTYEDCYVALRVHFQSVADSSRIEALLRDTCNARRASYILLNLVALFNELHEQKLINSFSYCVQKHCRLRHSDVIVV